MKIGSLIFVPSLFVALHAFSQAGVTVDVAKRLRTLTGRENGINLDYLMDGGFTNPSIPTSTALKNMNVRLLRYPGGEKSDNYLWSAAPWTAASPRMALKDVATDWPTQDSRFVDQTSPEKLCKPVVLDFDEFMTVSKAAGAEPLIVVAYDGMYNTVSSAKPTKAELIKNAVEWVRYANVTKKFGIKYWMIGNESWNYPDYNGQTTAQQYAADLYDFASAMKAVDPSIKIVANGISGWWPTMLQSKAVSFIDFFALSWYPVANYTEGYETYRKNNASLTWEIDEVMKDVATYAPAADKARIKVILSEYNSFDYEGKWTDANNLGHALANFQMFGDVVVNPNVESACMWNTRWVDNATKPQQVYDALDKNGNLNANGVALQIWGKNLLNTMVTGSSNNDQVKVYASYDTATKNLNIFLLNKDVASKTVNLNLANYAQKFSGTKYVFTGTTVDDKFPAFARADTIANASALASITLGPASVTVLKLAEAPEVPVTVLSFTGDIVTDNVLLNWKTQNDSSLLYYTVEKSTDSTSFSAIGSVTVVDHGNTIANYNFLDTSFVSNLPNYYRLKLVGRNGKTAYSNVLEMRAPADSTAFAVIIAPNPVMNELQIQVQSAVAQQATVQVVDALGRIWTSEKVQLPAGATSQTLRRLGVLPHGVYWLQVAANNQRLTIPFLKN